MRELEAWFESVHKMNQMDAIEKMNTSTQIHDTKASIMNLDKEEDLLAKKSCYRSGHSQHQVLQLFNDRGAAELEEHARQVTKNEVAEAREAVHRQAITAISDRERRDLGSKCNKKKTELHHRV